jgi:riboflavin kinase/FMN adenylyltransferase
MRIIRGLEHISNIKHPVITIGSFDGVHKAHQKIFGRLNSIARQIEGESVVITFDPHPRQIIYPKDNTLQLITTTAEKLKLLEQQGIDVCLLINFSVEFSQQSPKEYIEKFLIEKINPEYIIIGYDHRFGLNRSGDFSLLQSYEKEGHFKLIKLEKLELDEMTISSTKVRNYILSGEIEQANKLLGYTFELNGKVVTGEQIGRELGFPTANLEINEKVKIIPDGGIYAVELVYEGKTYQAMLYIGSKPTVNALDPTSNFIEVNILDFEKDIYGESVTVKVLKKIRNDQKFISTTELKSAIQKDEEAIRQFFKLNKNSLNTKANIKVSILNYNGKKWLEKYLLSVFESCSRPYILSIVDNASTDDSLSYLNGLNRDLEIIPLEKNFGFAGGYNLGLDSTHEKYIVLLNSDVRVSKDWLDPIIKFMESDDKIAVVQPKILSDRKPEYFEHAGASGGFLDALAYPFCRGRVFNVCEKDEGQYDNAIDVFWASGAAMVVRSDVWHRLGGFDDSFFAHMEEIDFCWRVNRAGYKIKCLPESVVYHYGGGTLDYSDPRKVYLNFRNNLKMILRNESFLKLLWLLPLRFLLDGIAGFKFLLEKNISGFTSIIKAHFAVYFSIGKIIKSRIRDSRKINDIYKGKHKVVRYDGSIVFDFYVNKKDTFNKIIN